jgi:hypothetical protein
MNEQEIKIGMVGKIIEGHRAGWFVFFKEDFEGSGGYLILIFNNKDMSKSTEGYDEWTENEDDLSEVVKEFNWKIEWLDKK